MACGLPPAFADLSSNKQWFAYPVDKRRTRHPVETLRRTEVNLDAFWEAMDRQLAGTADNLRGMEACGSSHTLASYSAYDRGLSRR